jgi:glycine oxidase
MRAVIIGAGVAGLAIGWRLRQAGAEVVVVDRGQPGKGATWAAAGMIAASTELSSAPAAELELGLRSRTMWADFAKEIEDASGAVLGYRQSGSLIAALTEQDASRQVERARGDSEVILLSASDARAMEPMLSQSIRGALFAPKEAQVDNRALGRALATAFMRSGGMLVANETVIRVESHCGRATGVCTPFRIFEGDAVILAAGAWSGQVAGVPPEASPPVRPMKGEMLALVSPAKEPPPERQVWGSGVYLTPRAGHLLIGATHEDAGFDSRLTRKAEDWLSGQALTLMPGLKAWRILEHWAGLRPASPDGLPILGPSAMPGLFIASGQHRNGILFAPAVAEIVADLVLGRPRDVSAFDPRRFAGRACAA